MFKRYIQKHGKKLGPYYYENIRSGDGKVKSVYIGTNPHHHPRHRIRKPLFLLILALLLMLVLGSTLFLLQNKSYLISKVRSQEPDFDIDQILLKVLIKSGEFIEKQARVMNTGSSPSTINSEVLGLEDIVHVNPGSFTIKPGQTKIVALNFSSVIPEQKIEQQPGVYVGRLIVKSKKASKEIPIIVEIESKNVLFDMNLNPVSIEKKVERGSDATIEVRLFNLQSIESASVDVEYTVKDINGNTITTESETVVAKTQASFFKKMSIPKSLKPGPYVFSAQSKFGNSVGTSSYLFEVTTPETEASFAQFCKNSIMCLGLSLTTILLLFALAAYFYFFIGAYLYEKVTGAILIPKKKGRSIIKDSKEKFSEQVSEKPSKLASVIHSLMGGIRRKKRQWKLDRERKTAEQERISKERALKRIEEERISQLEAKRKRLEEERKYQEELKKRDELRREMEVRRQKEELEKEEKEKQEKLRKMQELEKQKELERQEKIKREELLRKQEEIEEKRKVEWQKQQESIQKQKEMEKQEREAKRKMLLNERKKQAKEFFHKIGFYKTPEEKKAIALQKEKEKQEKLRKMQELEKQKEIERQEKAKREEELRKQEEIEEKRKQEELKKNEKLKKETEAQRQKEEFEKREKEKQESLRKMQELEKQKELERQEKIKREELLRKQEEIEEKRKVEWQKQQESIQKQKEMEKQKAEIEKYNLLKETEAELSEKNNVYGDIKRELKTLNSEKPSLENALGELNKKIGYAENEIANKTENEKELAGQKDILSEKFKKEKTDSLQGKKKEITERLMAKQEQLSRELEEGLGKLSPKQRKSAEKWKKLEAKAKLNIEKQNLDDEMDRHKLALSEKNRQLEEEYKTKAGEIDKKQKYLKAELEALESRKRQLSAEKTGIKAEIAKKEDKIRNTASKLEDIKSKLSELKSKLLKIKQETPGRRWGWLSSLMQPYKEKAQEALKFQKQKKEPEIKKGMLKPKAEAGEKTAGRSKKLEEFYKSFNEAKKYIEKNDLAGAKKLYTAARNAYLDMDYEERKQVYSELINFYNKLKK